MFYIASVTQLAGIFGMMYLQTHHKAGKLSTNPRAAYIADKQWTITLRCNSKIPENFCILSYSFLSLAHTYLKYTLLNGHWCLLLAALQKTTGKWNPVQICLALLLFLLTPKCGLCLWNWWCWTLTRSLEAVILPSHWSHWTPIMGWQGSSLPSILSTLPNCGIDSCQQDLKQKHQLIFLG